MTQQDIYQKFDEFLVENNGKYVEKVDNNALNQCVDLAVAWFDKIGVPRAAIAYQYAFQIYANASDITRQYFDLIPNSIIAVPQKGDTVVFKSGWGSFPGHVGISTGNSTILIPNLFEQNDPLGSPSHVKSYRTIDYFSILGWLRPKTQTETCDIREAAVKVALLDSTTTDTDKVLKSKSILHI